MQTAKRYLLPGLVFQSVVIGGGYGTGREIVQFFLSLGPAAGLAAMALSTAIFSIVCAVTYEFARTHQTFEYQSFFRSLIGRFSWAYELTWLVFMLLVLAVVMSAAGHILVDVFGLGYWVGVVGMAIVIGVLVFLGTEMIEKAFSVWSILLYLVFGVLLTWSMVRFGPRIWDTLLTGSAPTEDGLPGGSWLIGGISYAGYNLAIIPALLFSVRELRTRRESMLAGLLVGPIAMIPAFVFFVAMLGLYPDIVTAAVPATPLLEALDSRWFLVAFQVMLVGTLLETGTGFIHSVNERVAKALSARPGNRELGKRGRAVIAVGWLGLAVSVAQFGLIDLIAKGYGTMAWVFIGVYVLPVLTLGTWKLASGRRG
jgi:uncharacterized membrane protein YkvI